jgi:hypothetical protein
MKRDEREPARSKASSVGGPGACPGEDSGGGGPVGGYCPKQELAPWISVPTGSPSASAPAG